MVKNIALNKEKSLQSVFFGGGLWCLGRGGKWNLGLVGVWRMGGVGRCLRGSLCVLCFFIATFYILACNLLCICENIYLNLQRKLRGDGFG